MSAAVVDRVIERLLTSPKMAATLAASDAMEMSPHLPCPRMGNGSWADQVEEEEEEEQGEQEEEQDHAGEVHEEEGISTFGDAWEAWVGPLTERVLELVKPAIIDMLQQDPVRAMLIELMDSRVQKGAAHMRLVSREHLDEAVERGVAAQRQQMRDTARDEAMAAVEAAGSKVQAEVQEQMAAGLELVHQATAQVTTAAERLKQGQAAIEADLAKLKGMVVEMSQGIGEKGADEHVGRPQPAPRAPQGEWARVLLGNAKAGQVRHVVGTAGRVTVAVDEAALMFKISGIAEEVEVAGLAGKIEALLKEHCVDEWGDALEVQVVKAARLGQHVIDGRPRAVLFRVGSIEQARKVIQGKKGLRKCGSERVYIDRYLSAEEHRRQREVVLPELRRLREEGRKAFVMGSKLMVRDEAGKLQHVNINTVP